MPTRMTNGARRVERPRPRGAGAASGTGRARLQLNVSSMSSSASRERQVRDGRADPVSHRLQQVGVEAPQADGVGAEDAPEVVLGQAAEDVAQRLAVNGRRALEVRVVRPPHELVDADLVAHLGLVALHERAAQPDVLLEVVAGPHLEVGADGRAAVGVEERLHVPDERRQPLHAVLRDDDLEVGVAVEHAAEDHEPQRPAGEDEHLVEAEHAAVLGVVEELGVGGRARRAGVQVDHHPCSSHALQNGS